MIRIKIASPQEIVKLDYPRLREVGQAVLSGEGIAAARVTLAFLDDTRIHAINKRHLDHDEPTDVITFPYSGPDAQTLEGELAIGVEVAQRQAAERGHDVSIELQLYAIHGLLHLCGYDDRDVTSVREMRARERHYLSRLGLPDIAEE